MRYLAATVLLVLALAFLFPALPSGALESKVFAVTERSVSIDLGPNYTVSMDKADVNTSGIFSQDLLINNTTSPLGGVAYVSVLSLYDGTLLRLDPSLLSELFLSGGLSAAEANGDVDTGNWTTVNSLSRNVTVHTLQSESPSVKLLGGTYQTACWNVDENTYVLVVSFLDIPTTEHLIGTLMIQ